LLVKIQKFQKIEFLEFWIFRERERGREIINKKIKIEKE